MRSGYAAGLRVCLRYTRQHPEIIRRRDALLWSLNDIARGGAGLDIPPLDDSWLEELYALAEYEAEEAEGGGADDDDDLD